MIKPNLETCDYCDDAAPYAIISAPYQGGPENGGMCEQSICRGCLESGHGLGATIRPIPRDTDTVLASPEACAVVARACYRAQARGGLSYLARCVLRVGDRETIGGLRLTTMRLWARSHRVVVGVL